MLSEVQSVISIGLSLRRFIGTDIFLAQKFLKSQKTSKSLEKNKNLHLIEFFII